MYTKKLPFKDFRGTPRNVSIQFNLTVPEVIKLLAELKAIFAWQESISKNATFQADTDEVIDFYNNFEEIMLSSYGMISEDGLTFSKSEKYRFSESAAFAAYMNECLTDPSEVNRFLEGTLPADMKDFVQKVSDNLETAASDPSNSTIQAELQAEVDRLRAQLTASQS